MARITFKNINKTWGVVRGVCNFNLEIDDREFIVLLGPSGCGKTTTMRMVAGLETPSSGEIKFDDQLINHLEPKNRDVAMVFQGYGLYPNLTVYENIRFPLKVRKVNKNLHDERVRKAASRVDLDLLLDRRPKELSGGQRQRVALARAIVREPKVFLMDEPLSNLDAKLRVSTRAEIKHLQYQLKVTTIYVTHDQIEAMTLADRVIVMNLGQIQQVGTPREIYNNPKNKFVAGFIGSPAMNLIDGNFSNETFSSEKTTVANWKVSHTGEATLGFRPEDAQVSLEKPSSTERKGTIEGNIYSCELLGDTVLVSFKMNDKIISARTDKNFTASLNQKAYFMIPNEKCVLFHKEENGSRII